MKGGWRLCRGLCQYSLFPRSARKSVGIEEGSFQLQQLVVDHAYRHRAASQSASTSYGTTTAIMVMTMVIVTSKKLTPNTHVVTNRRLMWLPHLVLPLLKGYVAHWEAHDCFTSLAVNRYKVKHRLTDWLIESNATRAQWVCSRAENSAL